MTFSDLILLSRRRLHDYRTASAAVITNASENGIRWSSAELQIVCKGALLEMLRTLRALQFGKDNKKTYIHVDVQHQIILVTLVQNTGLVTGLPDISPSISGFIQVKRIQSTNVGMIYHRVSQEVFQSKIWRLSPADTDDAGIGASEGVFTSYWNSDTNKLETYVYPAPLTSSIANCKANVVVPLNYLFTLASTVQLPFIDIDDLILDYVELHASLTEHDVAQAKSVREVINVKLQELKNELQENS